MTRDEITAIRSDAQRYSEEDIVRLCDFTLLLLGPCCDKPETCEQECIYRWKHAAKRRADELEAMGKGDTVSVPRNSLHRYRLMLGIAATVGLTATYADGTDTPNAKICRDCSNEIKALLAVSEATAREEG